MVFEESQAYHITHPSTPTTHALQNHFKHVYKQMLHSYLKCIYIIADCRTPPASKICIHITYNRQHRQHILRKQHLWILIGHALVYRSGRFACILYTDTFERNTFLFATICYIER